MKRKCNTCLSAQCAGLISSLCRTLIACLAGAASIVSVGHAQVMPPITSSGLNTQVTLSSSPPTGKTQYDITGGIRPGGGQNLFHSFGQFNVPTNNIANFLNDAHLVTTNILARVTDPNPSNIFGTIQTTGFGNANLFLMNPSGIVFGPNATLNVGGSVHFTTANYLRLADNAIFNAAPNAAADALLSAAPVTAFGFLGSPSGLITLKGGQLSVPSGQSISLVGGNVTVQSGVLDNGTVQAARLLAPNGQIHLASAASPGEFLVGTLQPAPNIKGQSFSSFGSVSLAPGATIDVSQTGKGSVSIRGGQFVLSVNNAMLTTVQNHASTVGQDTIVLSTGSSIVSATSGADSGPDVQIVVGSIQMDGASIQSTTTGSGQGGGISISADTVNLINGAQIVSSTAGTGTGGDIAITATNTVSISGFDGTGTLNGVATSALLDQNSGLPVSVVTSGVFSTASGAGNGGLIGISAPTVDLSNAATVATINTGMGVSSQKGGDVRIAAGNLQVDGAFVQSGTTGDGSGGSISITADTVSLTNGAQLVSNTSGAGAGGNITVSATDSVSISGYDATGTLNGITTVFADINTGLPLVTSGVFTTTSGSGPGGAVTINAGAVTLDNAGTVASITSGDGRGGDLALNVGNLAVQNGGLILSSAGLDYTTFGLNGNGRGGDITVIAQDSIQVSGFNPNTFSESSIWSTSNNTGDSGSIALSAPNISVKSGGIIQTLGQGTGNAGNITIAADQVSVSGTDEIGNASTISSLSAGTGKSGAITMTVQSVNVGNLGSIQTQGNGGTITIHATQGVNVTDGGAISSLGGGIGTGDLTISADQILVSGFQGPAQSRIETKASALQSEDTGKITLTVRDLVVTDSGRINTEASGSNALGGIHIDATESVTVSAGGKIRMATTGGSAGPIEIIAPAITLDQGILQTASFGSGNAGSVTLRGNNVTLLGGFINSQAEQATSGRGGDITINVTDTLSVAGRFNGSNTDSARAAGFYANALGKGQGGNISITTGDLVSLSGTGTGLYSQTAFSSGTGGAISIQSPHVQLSNGAIITAQTSSSGNAGNILIKSDMFNISSGATVTASSTGPGNAGTITIQGSYSPAQSLVIDGSGSGVFTNTSGTGAGGDINVASSSLVQTNGGTLSAKTSGTAPTATGGTITVNADQVQVNNGGLITAESTGFGNAGAVNLNATGSFQSNGGIVRTTAAQAQGGDITVKAGQSVQLSNGGILSASSAGAGKAGNVTVAGLNGQTPSVQITGNGSGLFTDASGSGAGGNISITAGSFSLNNGGKLSATTSGNAASAIGGTIIVNANQVQLNNAGLITAASTGQGNAGSITINATGDFQSNGGIIRTTAAQAQGGDITITAGQDVTLTNNTSISASSSGAGNAGNITVRAGDDFIMQNSSITTQAAQASGGNIKIGAQDQVVLQNSLVSASVQGGSGSGGNIDVDPAVVVLQNSQILAQAVLGNGGNITITTPLFLADQSSVVSASSQFGLNGTVTIQSPTSNLSGTVASLPSSMRQAHALQTGRCAALANSQSSSFLIAGRETVPTEPGGWLPSPFALVGDGMGLAALGPGEWQGAGGEAQVPMMLAPADGTVSVRRLTPAGFLTQSFAEGGSTGCRA